VKLAYLDAFSGIAGDMTVGALLDCGLDLADLERELAVLRLDKVRLRRESRERSGIHATKFVVEIDGMPAGDAPHEEYHGTHGHDHGHDHSHGHDHEHPPSAQSPRPEPHAHPHRPYREIRELLERSALGDGVKRRALAIFGRLAAAEGKVHGVPADDVHFHEVGALDAIADVVGAAWGFDRLGVDEVRVSPLPMGRGFARSGHGRLPVPGPATLDLLRDFPIRLGDGESEMVTPTGAAIVAALATPGAMPVDLVVERIGYGAGDKEFSDRPNLLRVVVGTVPGAPARDRLLVLETNLDDMNPELYEHVVERLFAGGALDVWMTPVQMKKNRPGTVLSVLANAGTRERVTGVLLAETTTLGVRITPVERIAVPRESVVVETSFGAVRVKIGTAPDGGRNVAPEYADCRRIALERGVPLKHVYQAAIAAAST
jgi:pyridinium-3,5-bisthiocarboxylic acid mononucleotide nickel chelatase